MATPTCPKDELLLTLDAAEEMKRIGDDIADYLSIKAHTQGLNAAERKFLGAWDVPSFRIFRDLPRAREIADTLPEPTSA